MKKIIIYSLTTILTFLLVSCDDFLSKDPDPRATIDTPEQVSQLLVSAYPDISYYHPLEVMSDNSGDVRLWYENAVNTAVEQAYWWENVNGYSQDTPWGYWMSAYEAIAVTNHALEAIEQGSKNVNFEAQRAEALICRAYLHFMLVNIFSKNYNATTSGSDLGIPYVTKPEKVVFENYKRGTVANVYEKIEKDLQEGLKNIGLNNFKVSKYHFNLEAAHAFAARFYLFKNEPDSVIKYATLALGENPEGKIRALNGSNYLGQVYKIIESNYTSSDESCNLLLGSTISTYARSPFDRYKLTPQIKAEIYDTNVTGAESLSYPFYTYALGDRTIHTPKFKEWFKYESVNATYGYPYIMSILFTADEALLNRAEAYAMLNTADATAEAYKDLNLFYSKRVEDYNAATHNITPAKVDAYAASLTDKLDPDYTIPASQMNLMKVIVDTRRKEFIMEAMRWFDIRRFNIEIQHSNYDNTRIEVLRKGDPRREVQIPLQAISAGLEANPR